MGRRGAGEGTIRQRKSGRWEARVTLGYGPDGRQRRKSVYGDTRGEVQQIVKQVLLAKEMGLDRVDERQTVKQFLERWLVDCHKPSVRHSTWKRSEQVVRVHLVPEIGHVRLVKLTPHEVQALLNRKLKSGLTPRTVEIIRAVLRTALNQAVRWGDVPRNVAELANAPRVPKREIEPLTAEEARRLLDALEGERLKALFVLAVSTGLRQGELLGLRWPDIDLGEGVLRVRHGLQRQDGEYRFVEPKSKQSRRTLPLPGMAVSALRCHRVSQAEERLEAGPKWEESDLVLPTRVGRPMHPSVVRSAFRRALKTAGLKQQRFHDLRHCCATLLAAGGAHPREIMKTLSHSQISVTMNVYNTHAIPSRQRETAEWMDAMLAGR